MPRRLPRGSPVLDWADRSETAIGWRVVVRRGQRALPWTPSAIPDVAAVDATRCSATRRAREITLDLRVEGPVALWSHPVVPVLASAALVSPELVLERITAVGLTMPDMHVVSRRGARSPARGRRSPPASPVRRRNPASRCPGPVSPTFPGSDPLPVDHRHLVAPVGVAGSHLPMINPPARSGDVAELISGAVDLGRQDRMRPWAAE